MAENGSKSKKRMHVNVDEEIHKRLRIVAPEITGKIRGAIEDAVNEALYFWIMKVEDELDVKKGAHTVWSLNYHFVFVPKYRKKGTREKKSETELQSSSKNSVKNTDLK